MDKMLVFIKRFFFEKERNRTKWKENKTLFKNIFIWKHGKGSEEIFPSKIKLIIIQEWLTKCKISHFLIAKSVL